MPEESGPLAGYNFTDAVWRAINGPEPSIVGDVNGSAYALTLPAGSDNALLGSATQDSVAVVGGFMHRIPAGQTQAVTLPPSSDPTVGRTDIIVARLDLGGFTSPPGPVRLARVAGVEGSAALPTLDEGPPGVEDFPLWAVTRRSGQGLNQAARRWLGRRSGPNLDVPAGEALPTNVPLGTRAVRGGIVYRRQLNSATTPQPEWFNETEATAPWVVYDTTNNDYEYAGHGHRPATRRTLNDVDGRGRARRKNGASFTASSTGYFLLRIPDKHRPAQECRGTLQGQNTADAGFWSIYRNDPVYPNDPDFSILRAFPSITTGWLGIDGARWAID
jgi:hypothetical protein